MVLLYKLALKRSSCVFFQNQDDRNLFIQKKIVEFEQTHLLPGSGVNLEKFRPSLKNQNYHRTQFSFILIARLIKDKGVVEFVEAAKIVFKYYPTVHFKLLGFLGVQNPTAISNEQITNWQQLPFISYLGQADDVRPFIEASDCVVLPSYREGTPKVLLEAAAMGKPIITTDVPGCRDVVEDNLTGFLCEVRSPQDLALKMCQMIELSADDRSKMGNRGRLKMEKQFNEKIVIDRYLEVIRLLN
jgi:glycosyltransferase involved in cell wall biosynthesis